MPFGISSSIHQKRMAEREVRRAMQSAEAARLKEIFGEAYIGLDRQLRPVFWRKTTIPKVKSDA